jgi:selenide,water dikinase
MALGDPTHGLEPVSFEIDHASFSYFPGAVEAACEGHLSGGLRNNRVFVGECAAFESTVPIEYQDLLFDPQTSGGFLVAIAPDYADSALAAFARQGVAAHRIGRVIPKASPLIKVL